MNYTTRNVKTGAAYSGTVSMEELERAVFDGLDTCAGPCACTVEPDGHCPDGWESRLLAMGMI